MSTSPATEIDPLVAFYRRRHPAYEGRLLHWLFCQETYKGGREWFLTNIFKYLKEGENEFAERLARCYRFNHTREAVDLVQKYLFKADVKRDTEGAPKSVQAFWKKATRSSQTIDELMRAGSTKSSLTGRCAVVVDRATPTGQLAVNTKVSRKEAREVAGQVYAYVVPAEDVLDYSWSEHDGDLNWIKLRETYRDDVDPITSRGETHERVRLWTRTDWTLFELKEENDGRGNTTVRVEVTDAGEHGLGFVPVMLLDHSANNEVYESAGLVDDIAYLDRAIANYLSNLDAIIQDQTFSQLAIPASGLSGAQDADRKKVLEMGTKRLFTYEAGAGSSAKPEFISPDPKQAGVILAVVSKIINEIYHTIGLAGERTKEDNAVGIDNSSGVAKAYDFERVNSLLLSKARRLQMAENWIVRTVLAWEGETAPKEDLVTYPSSFDVASLSDELVTAEALLKVEAPIEIRREQMKSIVEKLLPQVKQETWNGMMAAIGKWEPTPKVAPGAPQPGAGKKPAATPSRQGSVTPDTKAKSPSK